MKKLIAFLIPPVLACLTATAAMAQDHPGNISHTRHIIYTNPVNQPISSMVQSDIWFDRQGKVIEEKHYDRNGTPLRWERHTWSEGSRVHTACLDSLGTESATIRYGYDGEGRLVNVNRSGMNGLMLLRTQYVYDEEGHVKEFLRVSADSSTFSHTTYDYDRKGRLSSSRWYDRQGNVRTTFVYGKNAGLPPALSDTISGSELNALYVVRRNKVSVMRRAGDGRMYLSGLIILGKEDQVEKQMLFSPEGKLIRSQENGGTGKVQRQFVTDNQGNTLEIISFEGDRVVRIEKFIHDRYSE